MKIRTSYQYPPIPCRSMDWSAVDDDTYDGPGSIVGWGRTEQDAIEDLLDQMEDAGQRDAAEYDRTIAEDR